MPEFLKNDSQLRVFMLCAVFLFINIPSTSAATYYVATTGNDSNSGTQSAPFKTIQKAAGIVSPGDTVLVGDGIYTDTGTGWAFLPLSRGGNASAWVTFKSQNKWGAKIQGPNYSNGINFYAEYIRIEGFDISGQNGQGGPSTSASAIGIEASNIQIVGNNIHDVGRICTDTAYGLGGIFSQAQSNITVEGNIIHNIGRLSPGEQGCNIDNGYYKNHDHGYYIESGTSILIKNNIFYRNELGWSVHAYPSAISGLKILNNAFAFPNPNNNGQIILAAPISGSVIANNIFYQPLAAGITACCGYSASGITINNNLTYGGIIADSNVTNVNLSGNINNTDPKLADPSGLDFRLQSTSPAINAGATLSEVLTDYDGVSRPQGSAYDIGAYEYASGGSTQTLLGDINGDRIVNSLDWSLMSSKWLTSDISADLNKDGAVNSLDWSMMSGNWLKTN